MQWETSKESMVHISAGLASPLERTMNLSDFKTKDGDRQQQKILSTITPVDRGAVGKEVQRPVGTSKTHTGSFFTVNYFIGRRRA